MLSNPSTNDSPGVLHTVLTAVKPQPHVGPDATVRRRRARRLATSSSAVAGDQHGCDERDLREARPQRQFGRRLPAGAEAGQQRRGYLRQQRQYRPRQQPDEEDACGGQRHGGDAVVVRLVHFGHLVRAGRTEEDDAVEFGEGEQSQSADQGERRDARLPPTALAALRRCCGTCRCR